MKNLFSLKPTILVSIFVLTLVAMPKTQAAVDGPTIISPDNLRVSLPATVKANKSFAVAAETNKYALSSTVTEVVYKWTINTCGTNQVVTKYLSKDPVAYRHYFQPTYSQGCQLKVDVYVNLYSGSSLYGTPKTGSINAKLTTSDDITLTGPTTVKVGTNAEYKAVYEMNSNQKDVWFRGTSCRITKTGGVPSNGVYLTGFIFHWEPRKVQSCNVEAVGVYTSNNSLGLVESIEIATKKLNVTSVN